MIARCPDFNEVVGFHGHACPGLAFGYRVSQAALEELVVGRSLDEELVVIVENNSCAVDAIQAVTGCTFGKGNFIFRDFGKQVYTFIRRSDGEAVRIAVEWEPEPEQPDIQQAFKKYSTGDRSSGVVSLVNDHKQRKMKAILVAEKAELFRITRPDLSLPEQARIFPTLRCVQCGEKVMESRTVNTSTGPSCIPCSEELSQA